MVPQAPPTQPIANFRLTGLKLQSKSSWTFPSQLLLQVPHPPNTPTLLTIQTKVSQLTLRTSNIQYLFKLPICWSPQTSLEFNLTNNDCPQPLHGTLPQKSTFYSRFSFRTIRLCPKPRTLSTLLPRISWKTSNRWNRSVLVTKSRVQVSLLCCSLRRCWNGVRLYDGSLY